MNKVKLIVDKLNEDAKKSLPIDFQSGFPTTWLPNLPVVMMNLSLKYKEDFAYDVKYGVIRHKGLLKNKLVTDLTFVLNEEQHIVRETVRRSIFSPKIVNIRYEILESYSNGKEDGLLNC